MAVLNLKAQRQESDSEAKLLGDLYQAVFELNYIECQSLQQSFKPQVNKIRSDRMRQFEKAGLKKNSTSESGHGFSEIIETRDKVENWMVI
jgi:hypothetical protein